MLLNNPLVAFTILLAVILLIPPIFEKLRLPGLVGLLVAGIVLGDGGLGILMYKSETIKLLSDIGKIYLMFVAGLEIDLEDFKKKKNRALGFGISTFLVPLLTGTLIGRSFGFSWNASILIGSLLASHTLLGYPIIQRLGLTRTEPVAVTVGATIFTDIAALLVLAICVSIHQGEFSATSLVTQLVALALYCFIVLFGFDRAGKEYFRRTGDQEGNQFLFVLLVVFLASVGAQIINIDQIVGAFLAGLAVNDALGNGPVKEKVEFVGGVLFIPFFFVGMGMLLQVDALIETLTTNLWLTLAIVGGLIVSKWVASFLMKLLYHYRWREMLTMWSLSMPQVAATLAAALAAYETVDITGEPLISKSVFSTVIVLMLVTSILGPLLTERFASKLPIPQLELETESPLSLTETPTIEGEKSTFRVLVPVYNPLTQRYLISMAALLARHESGDIVTLAIVPAHVHMDEPTLEITLKQTQRLMERAMEVSQEFRVRATPIIRIDDDASQGISRAAKEQGASLIVMGWSPTTSLRARLFGNVIDQVFWASHCPVAVMRLLDQPVNIHKILVPVKDLSVQALRVIQFAELFADANQAEVTLLHVCDRRTRVAQIEEFERQIATLMTQITYRAQPQIKTVRDEDVAKVILEESVEFDLLVLRSTRRRTIGGLAVSDVTTEVIKKSVGSIVLLGEPHS